MNQMISGSTVLNNEQKEDLLREVLEVRAGFILDQLMDMIEYGPPIPGRKNPEPERLKGYLKDTLQSELPMILDPDYLEKVKTGEPYYVMGFPMGPCVPPAQYIWRIPGVPEAGYATPEEAAQACTQMGIQEPPQAELSYWWRLFQLPKGKGRSPFKHFQMDFINLLIKLGNRGEAL